MKLRVTDKGLEGEVNMASNWREEERTVRLLSETPPRPSATRPATPSPAAETPDAINARRQLNVAKIYIGNSMNDKAKEILQAIVRDFPQTPAAKDARIELDKLK